MRLSRLGIAVAASVILQIVGAVFAIQQRLAYGFGGQGDPNNVARDFFLGGGTAESPPVLFLGLLVLAGLLAAVRGWGSIIGCVALIVLSVLDAIGFLGEPHTRHVLAPRSLEPGWAAYELIALASVVAMFALAVQELAARRRIQPLPRGATKPQPRL